MKMVEKWKEEREADVAQVRFWYLNGAFSCATILLTVWNGRMGSVNICRTSFEYCSSES